MAVSQNKSSFLLMGRKMATLRMEWEPPPGLQPDQPSVTARNTSVTQFRLLRPFARREFFLRARPGHGLLWHSHSTAERKLVYVQD